MPPAAPRPIRILSNETARRIAAGEVIDRPAAVLRELLDNALDAGATSIECRLEEGGNARIRVVDNGGGIPPADLELCGLPHATSKIAALEDLDRLATLGFRGEALSSMAACARLEITSTAAGRKAGRRLLIEGGRRLSLEETGPLPGTVVDVSRLFFNMPARKRFLKRPQTEGTLCRTVFTEKALAHPGVAFRLWSDGKMMLFLPPASLVERVSLAHERAFPPDFLETHDAGGPGFSVTAVCSGPEVSRPDRKFIQIYVNRRRIFEYSLLQAVEYGYDGYLPGGLKPIAFVFIDIDPALVDFNIHPAKREARFRNLPLLHGAVVALIKSFLQKHPLAERLASEGPAAPAGGSATEAGLFSGIASPTGHHDIIDTITRLKIREGASPSVTPAAAPDADVLRYLGQLWDVYLAGLLGGELILVDQHAAHERLLFDDLAGRPLEVEQLAIPIAFELEDEEIETLEGNRSELEKLGFKIDSPGGRAYELAALPAALAPLPEQVLIDFLKGERADAGELRRRVLALAACRSAVKQGASLDPVSAHDLLVKALALPDPRCPHGRPVIVRFPRAMLDKLFRRDV
jgi:DNA mismatch repair protein MutL